MNMKNFLFGITAFTLTACGFATQHANAQSSVLAEIYGRGVHAHYAGHTNDAHDLFSMAINNGLDDPRAYYFRGISLYKSGREIEAESDWQQGASLEARGKGSGSVGAALHRFQGAGRLKLEQIRQKARLEFLAEAAARSRARYGEIEAAEPNVLRSAPQPNRVAPPAAAQTPPPAPQVVDDNPFSDDMGEPAVESDDALADAMDDPFADDGAGAADAGGDAPAADPFGGDGGAAADPFGGGDAGADPFGGGGAMDDPFGGDPFGN